MDGAGHDLFPGPCFAGDENCGVATGARPIVFSTEGIAVLGPSNSSPLLAAMIRACCFAMRLRNCTHDRKTKSGPIQTACHKASES